MISFPAPALCQGADEDLLLRIGAIIFSGAIERSATGNELRIWVPRQPSDPTIDDFAIATFQTVLGVLRAWRHSAGQLRNERRRGLGEGALRDPAGNQWIWVAPVFDYGTVGSEIEDLAYCAREGIAQSQNLRNALWLNGRAGRTSAEFYMIHEYAVMEFDGTKGIRDALGLSRRAQEELTKAANNLSPLDGGRHVRESDVAPLSLDGQAVFTAELLLKWIRTFA